METSIKADSLLKMTGLIMEKNKKRMEETGGMFNVFSVLNMERLEVQTHSAFIYELLNPKGSHSQGNSYLKLFIGEVLGIKNFDLNNVTVERERSIGPLGRIDMVIESRSQLIIVEIKVDAGDQKDQLKRYDEYARKSGKEYKIYYLTLFGYEASDYSTGNGEIPYECISFETDILAWIKGCVRTDKTPLLPGIRETLVQYSKLIEKITNQLDGGLKMEIKDLLLKGKNLNIAQQIAKAIPYCKAELEYKFWKEMHDRYEDRIAELGTCAEGDFFNEDDANEIEKIFDVRKKKKGSVWFEYKVMESDAEALFLEIGCGGYDERIYMSLAIATEEEYIVFKDYYKKVQKAIEDVGFTNKSDYRYCYIDCDLNFNTEKIFKLQDEEYFENAVECVGKAIVDAIVRIKENKELNEAFGC